MTMRELFQRCSGKPVNWPFREHQFVLANFFTIRNLARSPVRSAQFRACSSATTTLPVTRETHPKQAEPASGKTRKLLNNMNCGESAPNRCRTHNPKVAGSNPAPATNRFNNLRPSQQSFSRIANKLENPKSTAASCRTLSALRCFSWTAAYERLRRPVSGLGLYRNLGLASHTKTVQADTQ